MNDDQLSRELQRRADSAGSRPDWVRRDLLPAVRHEIDTRPQRVMTSNWSPRLGVAAVVAALLILVIAVPRLAPQPPSATSTPPLGLVMSTADFGAKLASGGLDGQTVLVDGGIVAYDGPPIFGSVCGGARGRGCIVGQLEGIAPRVVVSSPDIAVAASDDSTVQVSPGWPWWTRVSPPINGTLLLSVDQLGGVTYVGRARLNGGQLIWSVADAAGMDVNSLARDEVALVNGRLSTKYSPGTVFDCATPPFPDLAGLPSRYCVNTGFLSGPNNAGQLQVQEDALQFAPAPVEQAALYAISPRLYGGGCGGAPPCWLWDVVARLDPVSASPTASPPPGPETVLSTSEFADGVASGQLVGRVVLVQGKISVPSTPEPADYPCNPPDGLCGLGALEGTDPVVYVDATYTPTTDSPGSGTWAGSDGGRDYHFPTVPIDGVLALRVLSGNHVEFVGLASPNGDSRVRSVAEAEALDINSVSRDEVILVRGWLVDTSRPGEFVNIDCVPAEFPDLTGLPSRYCKLTDVLSSSAPEGLGVPRVADTLTVQVGAADRFAANLQGQEAIYAISPRLYGGGCSGAPPCWLWDVVAHVDGVPSEPLPTASVVPTTPPAPSPSTGLITCSAGVAGAAFVAGAASLRDNTGKVVSCASELGSEALTQNVTVSNPGGDAQELRIDLRVSSCDIRALRLEFWEPPVGHALGEQFRPTHDLQIARSEDDIFCVDSATEITSQTISLLLKTPIDATNVNAFVTTGAVGSNTIETHGNTFALTLTAGSDTYAAGTPIDVFATRGYLGPEKTTVASEGMWFGFEQLDGTLEMWPATTTVGHLGCTTEELQQGDVDTRVYSKSGSWSNDDPNAALYEQYIHDPLLLLPSGVYRLFAVLSFTNGGCGGEPVSVDTSIVIRVVAAATTPQPTPSPSPSLPIGTRVLSCDGSEALGNPGITLIDHSGRIGGCSMAQADSIPDGKIDVTTTGLPNQLAATWIVNPGCPTDDQLEFWGPIQQPIGLAEYILQLARQRAQRFDPATCWDVLDARQVQIAFTVLDVRPADILAVSVDRSAADGTVSSTVTDANFELQLAATQAQTPNEPIDITSRLTYHGTDPVTLSGAWQPDFAFSSLTRGPNFKPYGSLLLCPDTEVDLSPNESVSGQLEGGIPLDPADPNYDYRTQYAYDGKVRLPGGAYLIYTGVGFNVGSNCTGERVHLWGAIVVEVGLVTSSWDF